MPGPTFSGMLALEQVRDAARELDHLDAALDAAAASGRVLPGSSATIPGELRRVRAQQPEGLLQHARAPLRRRVAPGGKRRLRRAHRGIDVRAGRHRHSPDRFPRGRVGDVAGTRGGRRDGLPANPEG